MAQSLGIEHELMFSLAVDNGLRIVDMRRLTLENGDRLLKSGTAMILGKGRYGGKLGKLTLSKMTFARLAKYLRNRKQLVTKYHQDLPQLLIKENKTRRFLIPYNHDWQLLLWKEVVEAAGIEFPPHDGRATNGKRLRRKSVPLEAIAKLMRHESPDETFRSYTGYDDEELRQVQDLLVPYSYIQQKDE